jgi:8-oxo-dGTP pyrophosphatase MutT (NUDIX family)
VLLYNIEGLIVPEDIIVEVFMSDYMKMMRGLVGSRPIFQNGASVIVVDAEGRILLGLRSDNNCWGYAGGSVELGEQVAEAAIRELEEEFGIRAIDLELFGVFSGKELYYMYPNGDEVYNIDTVYICRHFTGILKADEDEILQVRFFDIDEMPENLSPPIINVINAYLKSRPI